jgi:acyl-[acyl-carrier-protein]-phospholipid O-acyltransferase/long-chain-fatty-acid--[acyl-carrier-protein] ligase
MNQFYHRAESMHGTIDEASPIHRSDAVGSGLTELTAPVAPPAPIAGSLLGSKRFLPLFVTQLLSAFTDNFLKNAVVLLILFGLAGEGGPALVPLAGAIFILPFVLLSALGGQIADRNDKAIVARYLKLAEIGAAAVAVTGLYMASVPVMFAALFAFGVVSAMFGPVKYGILPDHLSPDDLPRANAWIEGATFFAILSGTVGAGLLSGTEYARGLVGPAVAVLAVACWACSFLIPSTGAGDPTSKLDPNILRSTWREVAALRLDARLFTVAAMQAWFWTIGAVCLSILPILVRDTFGGDQGAVTLCLATFAVAVAAGSAVAAALIKGRVVLLPVPIGALMMAGFSADLAWSTWGIGGVAADGLLAGAGGIRSLVDLAGIAFSGALVAVPAAAALQAWSDSNRRARTVAGSNILSAVGMAFAGIAVAGGQAAGISVPEILAILAVLNLVAAVLMYVKLPTKPIYDVASIYFRVFHRMEVRGLENVAKAGNRMILAPNHTSFLDGPLALALTDLNPVFAVNTDIATRWWVRPFLARTRAMPMDPTKPIGTRTLVRTIEAGDPVVIFPEGRISVTGSLMKVYDGAAMVADKTGASVVPVHIDGLERSPLSRMKDTQVRRKLFPKVVVTIGEPRAISVDQDLRGAGRRAAAGAALYEVMANTGPWSRQ